MSRGKMQFCPHKNANFSRSIRGRACARGGARVCACAWGVWGWQVATPPNPPSNALNGAKRKVSDEHERQSKRRAKSFYGLLVALSWQAVQGTSCLKPYGHYKARTPRSRQGQKIFLESKKQSRNFFWLILDCLSSKKGKKEGRKSGKYFTVFINFWTMAQTKVSKRIKGVAMQVIIQWEPLIKLRYGNITIIHEVWKRLARLNSIDKIKSFIVFWAVNRMR